MNDGRRLLFLFIVCTMGCGRIGYDDLQARDIGTEASAGSDAGDAGFGEDLAAGAGGTSGTAGAGAAGGAGAIGGAATAGSSGAGATGGTATAGSSGAGAIGGTATAGSGGQSGGAGAGLAVDAAAPAPDGDTTPPFDPTGATVAYSFVVFSAVAGTPGLGTDYMDNCPTGEAVIGFHGSEARSPTMPWLQAIQTQCGRLTIGPAPGYAVTTSTGMLHPAHGLTSGNDWSALCPANQVVVGFEGRQSDWIAQLTFRCAPLTVTISPTGPTLTVGGITKTEAAGSEAGSPFDPIDCAPGQIAPAVRLTTDNYPRSFRLVCGQPIVVR